MRLTFIIVALTLLVPYGVQASTGGANALDDANEIGAECAPPCGEINPRIMFEFEDLSRDPLDLSQGDSVTFPGTVTLWADADDEGYVPPDPQEPITISFSFPRLPPWAEMSIEPSQIDVSTACPTCFKTNEDPASPKVHYESVHEVTMTLDIVGEPTNTKGYDYGKLQLFAKSSESGIWNPGYGIKEVRVQGTGDESLESNSTPSPVPGPSGLVIALALAASAGLVAAYRRD